MTTVKTPNYFLTQAYTYNSNSYGGEGRTLPAGASVKPIERPYVPKHILEDRRWSAFNSETEIFCYCRFGIIAIPKNIIVEK